MLAHADCTRWRQYSVLASVKKAARPGFRADALPRHEFTEVDSGLAQCKVEFQPTNEVVLWDLNKGDNTLCLVSFLNQAIDKIYGLVSFIFAEVEPLGL